MTAGALAASRRRGWAWLLPTLTFVLLFSMLHLSTGARPTRLPVLFDALTAYDPTNFDQHIFLSLRLPRLCAALVSGAAIGLAGLLMQSLLRNPLAEPHILGLNAGASLAVVIATALPAALHPVALARPLIAGLGGALVFSAVLLLSSAGRLGLTMAKLTFCGIALSALASALVSAVLILDQETLEAVRFWLVGDLAGNSWVEVKAALAPTALSALAALAIAPRLDTMALGDASAIGLGVPVRTTRLLGLGAAALLSGAAVSMVGPIGFVGLIVPGLAFRLADGRHLPALALSAVGGAALLVAADLGARTLIPSHELPTGIMTALVGAPVFLAIVARRVR